MSLKISSSAFNGACVLSAVGSLPLHIMPILIASAILAERVTAAQAGLFAAMYVFGQLVITTTLPLMAVRFISNSRALQVCALLIATICISTQFSGKLFYLNWFLIGVCCGVLSYLGSTSAAAVENKAFAYAVRLGATLLVAGLTMLVFYGADKHADFRQLTATLAVVVSLLSVTGLYFYRPRVFENEEPPQRRKTYSIIDRKTIDQKTPWGLFYLFVFALAQIGFIVFAIESATQRGIDLSDALWAFALCKIVAAVMLLNRQDGFAIRNESYQATLLCMSVLLIGCLLVASSQTMLFFFLGILLWETSVNILSSSFQASVVEVNPAVGGMYLTSVLLFGSALGPIINGAAITAGLQEYFYCLVVFSVFLPLLWNCQKQGFWHRCKLELWNTGELQRIRNFFANFIN